MANLARIEIIEWRVLFDDEDELDLFVFAPGDDTNPQTAVIEVHQDSYDNPMLWEYEDPGDFPDNACATEISAHTIEDGQILTSHDGRKFRVSITEVQTAECDDCGDSVAEVVGCPDGAEVCKPCFNAGAH